MSDEKKRKSRSRENRFIGDSAIYEYTKRPLIFVSIAMIVAIIIAFVTVKPISFLVHKAEDKYSISAYDIELMNDKLYDIKGARAGQAVARLTISDAGVNTTVFYSLNRATLRNGVGLSAENSAFEESGTTYIGGYDEGEFRSLKAAKKDDVIRIKAADKVLNYKVEKIFFDNAKWNEINEQGKLVVFSVFSDFSEHKGENFYVVAEKVSEEVITNE